MNTNICASKQLASAERVIAVTDDAIWIAMDLEDCRREVEPEIIRHRKEWGER